jgi:hypothetical protein
MGRRVEERWGGVWYLSKPFCMGVNHVWNHRKVSHTKKKVVEVKN